MDKKTSEDRKEMERKEAVGEVFQFLWSNFDLVFLGGASRIFQAY